jgi:hypothetical protein
MIFDTAAGARIRLPPSGHYSPARRVVHVGDMGLAGSQGWPCILQRRIVDVRFRLVKAHRDANVFRSLVGHVPFTPVSCLECAIPVEDSNEYYSQHGRHTAGSLCPDLRVEGRSK